MKIVLAYILAIAGAEFLAASGNVELGLLIHTAILLLLLLHAMQMYNRFDRRVLYVLMLAPLLRILSLVMPLQQLEPIYWNGLVGIPLIIAAALMVVHLQLPLNKLTLNDSSLAAQGFIAITGIPISLIAYKIFQPVPLFQNPTTLALIGGSFILIIYSGFLEEIIFRFVIQETAREAFGGILAIVLSSMLFAIMYIGSLSPLFILFLLIIGVYFGFCVHKTGSIWGVVMAHSILAVGMLVVLPVLFR